VDNMTAQLSLNQLDDLLGDPLTATRPDLGAMQQAVLDALRLGQTAYGDVDPAARLFAERVLHLIQVRGHFSPPLNAVANIYWGVLLPAKLGAELQMPPISQHLAANADNLTIEELRHKLEVAVAELGCHNHPLLDRIADETGNLAMQTFVRNWYGSCQGFKEQLIHLVQRTTGRVRHSVLENIADELSGVSHDELRKRFINSVGFHYDAGEALSDPYRVPESYALMSFRTGVCLLNNPLFALGCFYSIEANWPTECKRMLANLRKRGHEEHDLEHWVTHAYADEHHAAEWLDVLLEAAATTRARAEILTGAVAQLHLRRQMYDTILAKVDRAAP
jgi:pyrroloquinoline quinone (PQQ) biosynthesis protein C